MQDFESDIEMYLYGKYLVIERHMLQIQDILLIIVRSYNN